MKGNYEIHMQRDAKRHLCVSVGTWGSKEGTHLVYPSESELVEMAMWLLKAAGALKVDRQSRKKDFRRSKSRKR